VLATLPRYGTYVGHPLVGRRAAARRSTCLRMCPLETVFWRPPKKYLATLTLQQGTRGAASLGDTSSGRDLAVKVRRTLTEDPFCSTATCT
jgi:hypothetical protein